MREGAVVRCEVDNTTKGTCYKCKETKDQTAENFYRRTINPSGFAYECKECAKAQTASWRLKNREEINKNSRKWHAENREEINKNSRKRHAENREERNKNSRKWHAENREERNKKKRKWRAENPVYQKAYREKHRERIKNYTAHISETLQDCYIRRVLRRKLGKSCEITPELIELKRAQLMTTRTLKQFKKWRSENEHTDHRND